MATVTLTNTLTAGNTAVASEVMQNFTDIITQVNGLLDATNLASNAITTAKITDANVTTAKIADLAITAAKLAVDAVITAKIEDLAVTNAKLAGSIATSKLSVGVIGRGVWKTGNDSAIISLTNQAVATAWTNVDLTTATSANAKIAFIQFTLTLDTIPTGNNLLRVWAKSKDDSAVTDANILRSVIIPVFSKNFENNGHASNIFVATVPVGLDSGQEFQYQVTISGGTWQYDLSAYVVGYIEDHT